MTQNLSQQFTFMVLTVSFFSQGSFAATKSSDSLESKLQSLAEASQKAKPACEKFKSGAEKIVGSPIGDPEKVKLTSASFKKLLAVYESYPGPAPEFSQATQLHVKSEHHQANHKAVVEALGLLYPCVPMEFFKVGKALLSQPGVEKWDSKTKSKVIAATKKMNKNAFTLTSLMLESALISELVEKGILKMSPEVKTEFETIRPGNKAIKAALEQIWKDYPNDFAKSFQTETLKTTQQKEKLAQIMSRVPDWK